MGKLNFKIHPLFYIIGIYFVFTGKVFSFLVYTISALIHELGHSIMAQKCGYKLVNVTLMPFGAVVRGDISGMCYQDEIKVALAGPVVNLFISVCLVALWWVFPESYPYTELAVTAGFALCVINLLPAFPLDGGRILLCTLSTFLKRKTAILICKIVGGVLFALFFTLFIFSLFIGVNPSLLLFAIFMLLGVLDSGRENRFVRLYQSIGESSLRNCKKIKTLAVCEDFTVKKLYAKIDGGFLYRIYVYHKDGRLKRILEPHDVIEIISTRSFNERLT